MDNLLDHIEDVLLMGPGPSYIHESVYEAISKKTLGHMDPYFLKIMDAIKEQLKQILNTQNKLTAAMSGTGSAGMETCFVNLVEAGDPVLVLINGVFGMRMQDVASRLGAEVDTLEFEWGTPVIVAEVKTKIAEKQYKIVAVVHAETSTGVCNPVAEIGEWIKDTPSIFLVDTVTSMGGTAIEMDKWGIDALYSGSQKCLSCPPGLAPVSFSGKAVKALQGREKKVPNWYLDLSMIVKYWEGQKRVYHHTAPINMLYALYQALYLILQEGLEQVYQRHLDNHKVLVAGLEKLGLKMVVEPRYRLPMLNSVYVPEDVDEASVRKALREEYKIEIGAGLGPLAGKIWRIGLMGHTARPESVARILDALERIL